MAYRIKPYTYQQAEKLNVVVKPSTRKGKKIDVFNKKGEKLASIGALGMGDYPTFMQTKGKEFADKGERLINCDTKKIDTCEERQVFLLINCCGLYH